MKKTLAIKVCGMRDSENINELMLSKPDFTGFIFYDKSKRFVGKEFNPQIIQQVNNLSQAVGVFVNETLENIENICIKYSLTFIQLHGNEEVEFCKILKDNGYKIIKAFGINEQFDFYQTKYFEPYCDFFIFDTATADYGGSGQKFDHRLLNRYNGSTPFLLSGGIDLCDVKSIKELNMETLIGVDINSRFETDYGKKDIEKIKLFIGQIKNL